MRARPAHPHAGHAGSPRQLRRQLKTLVDGTLWCLGCDVRHPDGNLLLAYGFARHAPPAGRVGATMYRCELGGDGVPASTLAVWGFGLLYAEATGRDAAARADVGAGLPLVTTPALALRRYHDLGPQITADPLREPCWRPDDFPTAVGPVGPAAHHTSGRLLDGLAAAIAAYERWVADRAGTGYRDACGAARPRRGGPRPRVPAAGLAEAWDNLARGYAGIAAREARPHASTCPPAPFAAVDRPVVPQSPPLGTGSVARRAGLP